MLAYAQLRWIGLGEVDFASAWKLHCKSLAVGKSHQRYSRAYYGRPSSSAASSCADRTSSLVIQHRTECTNPESHFRESCKDLESSPVSRIIDRAGTAGAATVASHAVGAPCEGMIVRDFGGAGYRKELTLRVRMDRFRRAQELQFKEEMDNSSRPIPPHRVSNVVIDFSTGHSDAHAEERVRQLVAYKDQINSDGVRPIPRTQRE
jgi:hypothetical protein